MEFEVGQKVKYKSFEHGYERQGEIHCIVEILDHTDKKYIGKKAAFVRQGPGYCSDKVLLDDLELVEGTDGQ